MEKQVLSLIGESAKKFDLIHGIVRAQDGNLLVVETDQKATPVIFIETEDQDDFRGAQIVMIQVDKKKSILLKVDIPAVVLEDDAEEERRVATRYYKTKGGLKKLMEAEYGSVAAACRQIGISPGNMYTEGNIGEHVASVIESETGWVFSKDGKTPAY